MDVLSGLEVTGKGGYHWVYSPKLDEGGFRVYIVEKMIKNLMENFPEEMREAIKQFTPAPVLKVVKTAYDSLMRLPQLPDAYFHPWRRISRALTRRSAISESWSRS